MPFINKKQAFELIDDIQSGKCAGSCRQTWMRNLKYALKTDTNPLHLTAAERKKMTRRLEEVKGRRAAAATATRKIAAKYRDRPSPPFPANEHCGEKKKGNDKQMYISVKDSRGVCRWKLA